MARPNIIDTKGLGDKILALRFEGKTLEEIAGITKVPRTSIHRWLANHPTSSIVAEKCDNIPAFPTKKDTMVEITQEIAKQKLGQIVGEAKKNYLKFSDDKTKDDSKAAYWFGQYQSAVEKLLRASGQYERARRLAEQEESTTVEVVWDFRE